MINQNLEFVFEKLKIIGKKSVFILTETFPGKLQFICRYFL